MTVERDRRAALADPGQTALNGIDFVEVRGAAETLLRVHFIARRPGIADLAPVITGATITGGERIQTIEATVSGWNTDGEGRPWVDLTVVAPGDFSTYTLQLTPQTGLLDPFFDHAQFSFKAECPSDIDCAPRAVECPPADATAPPIDYLAKDFQSFRKALSDFSALRYPSWQERSEADFGVMFMEALSSVADDLSYQQDRIAAEAWLETATQRRSLVRLARLVDYEPGVATAARTWLAVQMKDTWIGKVPAGLVVSALAPDGTLVDFETGTGLEGASGFFGAAAWNQLTPYWWDDREQCLPAGTTAMWVEDPGLALAPGRRLLIDTQPALEGDRPVREIVEIATVGAPMTDPLYHKQVVRVEWYEKDALRAEHDLRRTVLAGNLIPATQGRRYTERFRTSPGFDATAITPRAIVRTGANRTRQYLYTLRNTPLVWLAQDEPGKRPEPELHLTELGPGRWWRWRRDLLDPNPPREVVTVDPMRYRVIDAQAGAVDYDGQDGDTIRFGDGTFGAIPPDNAKFEVTYRAGGGARGNVAADAINRVDSSHPFAGNIKSVTNPLAAEGGRDQEPAARVREMAPQQFRAKLFRAVRAEDYEAAAVELSWVQRAGTTFRYTGSWLSVFTAVDPKASETVRVEQAIELTDLLNRRRLAGYESFTLGPRYASLDVSITVCVRPDAFRGNVKEALMDALGSAAHPDGRTGFFHPDHFTFGVALERSAIEAAAQSVRGVDGVLDVSYRRRGHTPDFVVMPDAVPIARDEIVRVDNDPSRPEAGSLQVVMVGGK